MRFLKRLLGAVVILAAAYFVFAWIWGVPRVEERATLTDPQSIAKGEYLAIAGDCTSCHSVPGSAAMGGGLPIATPFGTIYSTNITPATSGIAGMTSAEFYRYLAYGANSVWRPLYPAMVYTSYHLVTREDSDLMHAYFMSLPPVENKPPATNLMFPFNIRPGVFAWNLLFAKRGAYEPKADKDAAWNRGAYLVGGLAHCSACHTPRNMLYAEESGKELEGATLGTMIAPDITTKALLERGWSFDVLVNYLKTGNGPRGSAFGEMAMAIDNSLALMTDDDRAAIATYLLDGQTGSAAPAQAAPQPQPETAQSDGHALYLGNCALCHKANGEGIANTTPSLAGNSTITQADGHNLVVVTADGLQASQIVPGTGVVALGPMPAFRNRLTPSEITALSNYVRKTFGGGNLTDLTEEHVKGILDGK